MTFKGHVKNGTIVMDAPVSLPEGAAVVIEIAHVHDSPESADNSSFADRYAEFIGCMHDLPSDAAEQHDHYIYGTPKK